MAKSESKIDDKNKDYNLDFFSKKENFFNQSEKIFYDILHRELSEKYLILAKVRLEDILEVKKESSESKEIQNQKYGARSRIKSRHVDFLLLDRNTYSAVMAIELDGKSHNNTNSQVADEFKNKLFSHIGIPLHRINVGENFEAKIKALLI
jgi:hypothetical protein